MMAEDGSRSRLGRGLAALIGDVENDAAATRSDGSTRKAPLEMLRPNPHNPRRHFDETELDELAASIRASGLIQPIVARRKPDAKTEFEIVAGERRWRAAQRANLHEVPIVVVEIDDRTSLEFAIVENIQRSDLNPIEEATGYHNLIEMFHYSQSDLAQSLGRSRSHVANTLRLLKLPDDVKARLIDGTMSAGHARALLGVADPSAAAQTIIEKGLTVRDAERIAQREAKTSRTSVSAERAAPERKNADIEAVERALESFLGLPVSIKHGARGGELRVRYRSVEQLDAICKSLMQ